MTGNVQRLTSDEAVRRGTGRDCERLFDAFVDADARERRLPGAPLRERTSQRGRSARFDWEDGSTRVAVGFTPKDAGKSQVSVVHQRLPDAAAAERSQSYWRERLVALKQLLESYASSDTACW